MKKIFLLATSVAMTLAMTTRAEAAVQFNPNGTGCAGGPGVGGCVLIDVLDPTIGNSISTLNGQTSPLNSIGTVYFQANLGLAQLNGATQFSNGDGGKFFTIAAAFDEKLVDRVPVAGGNQNLVFAAPAATGDNGTFRIYAQTALGDNLAGTCFVSSCGGTLVLEGTLLNNTLAQGTFLTNFQDQGILDRNGADNWPGVNTIGGNGSFTTGIRVTFRNVSYFPDLAVNSTFLFATTQQSLPFFNTNPATCFSSDATTSCNYDGVANTAKAGPGVGAVNGLGANTILQTDSSMTFITVSEIPEPATMTMLGLGLLGVAAARKLRNRKA